jgi:hypothetical protein
MAWSTADEPSPGSICDQNDLGEFYLPVSGDILRLIDRRCGR